MLWSHFNPIKTIVLVTQVLSVLVAGLGFFMLYSKRLNRHPYQLYAVELLTASCANLQVFMEIINTNSHLKYIRGWLLEPYNIMKDFEVQEIAK